MIVCRLNLNQSSASLSTLDYSIVIKMEHKSTVPAICEKLYWKRFEN